MTPQEAEIAAANYWKSRGAVSTRRPVRTKWQKQDYLGADVLAVMPDGAKTWTQVTTSQLPNHIRERRRKLEAVPWAESDSVYVFEVEERPGVVSKRRTDRFFRVHGLTEVKQGKGIWDVWLDPIPIPDAWRKASWVPDGGETKA